MSAPHEDYSVKDLSDLYSRKMRRYKGVPFQVVLRRKDGAYYKGVPTTRESKYNRLRFLASKSLITFESHGPVSDRNLKHLYRAELQAMAKRASIDPKQTSKRLYDALMAVGAVNSTPPVPIQQTTIYLKRPSVIETSLHEMLHHIQKSVPAQFVRPDFLQQGDARLKNALKYEVEQVAAFLDANKRASTRSLFAPMVKKAKTLNRARKGKDTPLDTQPGEYLRIRYIAWNFLAQNGAEILYLEQPQDYSVYDYQIGSTVSGLYDLPDMDLDARRDAVTRHRQMEALMGDETGAKALIRRNVSRAPKYNDSFQTAVVFDKQIFDGVRHVRISLQPPRLIEGNVDEITDAFVSKADQYLRDHPFSYFLGSVKTAVLFGDAVNRDLAAFSNREISTDGENEGGVGLDVSDLQELLRSTLRMNERTDSNNKSQNHAIELNLTLTNNREGSCTTRYAAEKKKLGKLNATESSVHGFYRGSKATVIYRDPVTPLVNGVETEWCGLFAAVECIRVAGAKPRMTVNQLAKSLCMSPSEAVSIDTWYAISERLKIEVHVYELLTKENEQHLVRRDTALPTYFVGSLPQIGVVLRRREGHFHWSCLETVTSNSCPNCLEEFSVRLLCYKAGKESLKHRCSSFKAREAEKRKQGERFMPMDQYIDAMRPFRKFHLGQHANKVASKCADKLYEAETMKVAWYDLETYFDIDLGRHRIYSFSYAITGEKQLDERIHSCKTDQEKKEIIEGLRLRDECNTYKIETVYAQQGVDVESEFLKFIVNHPGFVFSAYNGSGFDSNFIHRAITTEGVHSYIESSIESSSKLKALEWRIFNDKRALDRYVLLKTRVSEASRESMTKEAFKKRVGSDLVELKEMQAYYPASSVFDICMHTKMSLDAACGSFLGKKVKGAFKHSLISCMDDALNPEIQKLYLPYVEDDVKALIEVTRAYRRYCWELAGLDVLRVISSARFALLFWQKSVADQQLMVWLPKDFKEEQKLRKAVIGGRTFPGKAKFKSKHADDIMETFDEYSKEMQEKHGVDAFQAEEMLGNSKLGNEGSDCPSDATILKYRELFKKHYDGMMNSQDFLTYQDANSLYPSLMSAPNVPFPIGAPRVTSSPKRLAKQLQHYLRRGYFDLGLFDVSVVPPRDLTVPVLLQKSKNGMLHSLKPHRGWYTNIDLDYAMKQGYVVNDLHESYVFDHGGSTDVFASFVSPLFALKQELEDGDPLRALLKVILNSLYGSMVKKAHSKLTLRARSREQLNEYVARYLIRGHRIEGKHIILDCEGVLSDDKKQPNSPTVWGAFILSATKRFMLEFIASCNAEHSLKKDTVYYSDTDSILVRSEALKTLSETSLVHGLPSAAPEDDLMPGEKNYCSGFVGRGLCQVSNELPGKDAYAFSYRGFAPKNYSVGAIDATGRVRFKNRLKGVPKQAVHRHFFAEELDQERIDEVNAYAMEKMDQKGQIPRSWSDKIVSIDEDGCLSVKAPSLQTQVKHARTVSTKIKRTVNRGRWAGMEYHPEIEMYLPWGYKGPLLPESVKK